MGLQSVAMDQIAVCHQNIQMVTQLSKNASKHARHNQIALGLNMEELGSGSTLQANVNATLQRLVGIRKGRRIMISI